MYTLSIEIAELLKLSSGYYDMAIDAFDFADSMVKEFKIEFSQNFIHWDQGLIDYKAKRLLEVDEAKAECIYGANQGAAKLAAGEWLVDDLKAKDPNCVTNNPRIFELLHEATSKKIEWKELAADTDWAK